MNTPPQFFSLAYFMMFVQNSKVIEFFPTKFIFALLPYSMLFILMHSHFTKVIALEIAGIY